MVVNVTYDQKIKININREFRKKFWHIQFYEVLENRFGKIHRFRFLCPCSGPWDFGFKVDEYPGAKKLTKIVEERLEDIRGLKENYEIERRLYNLDMQ